MELHLPYSDHLEISKEGHVWDDSPGCKTDLHKLCKMQNVELIEGAVCADHVHMYVAIPPKMGVASFMGYLKGKSALMLFDLHPEYKQRNRDRHF